MEKIFSLDNIREAAAEFWETVNEKKVFAIHGEMGAGKTTFIHALCEVKGVTDPVTSPTFSLINEYRYSCEGTPRVIFHMDLYRVNSKEEAMQAGIQDCLYSGNTCLVEWPEKAPDLFPPGTVNVFIDIINTDTRRLRISDK
jgi:tRNA threonylcarbamoyladenosine biosynthesis protein TsaE